MTGLLALTSAETSLTQIHREMDRPEEGGDIVHSTHFPSKLYFIHDSFSSSFLSLDSSFFSVDILQEHDMENVEQCARQIQFFLNEELINKKGPFPSIL